MKLLLLITTILLSICTAQAEWVKSGELDSMYLQDSEVSFSKYSPDYTKFVTYSKQDSTLRLFDLATGTIIKQRTFDWSYSYDLCEFDFEGEMFYFLKNKGQVYTNSFESKDLGSKYLWYINFNDTLKNIIAIKSYYIEFGQIEFSVNALVIKKNILQIHINSNRLYASTGLIYNYYSGNIREYDISNNLISFKDLPIVSEQTIKKYEFGEFANLIYTETLFGGHAGKSYNDWNSTYGMYIDFGNSTFQYNDFNYNPNTAKKYPYFKAPFSPLDVAYDNFVFYDSASNIKFYNNKYDYLSKYSIPYKKSLIRNFKLILSQRYSVFYKDTNKLLVADNQDNKLIDSVYFPEGTLGFENANKTLYSLVNNILYKRQLVIKAESTADIWSDKYLYFVGDTVKINSFHPDNIFYFTIEVDNVVYQNTNPNLVNLKNGFYSLKLSYVENGILKVVTRDSIFRVVDSLKVQYSIMNYNNNNAKYPFFVEASSNYPNAKFKWFIEQQYLGKVNGQDKLQSNYIEYNNSSASFYMNQIGTRNFVLQCTNEFQTIKKSNSVNINPNINLVVSSYSGISPFKFSVIFDKLYGDYLVEDQYYNGPPPHKCYYIGNPKIKDSIFYDGVNNIVDTNVHTLTIPGIYFIKIRLRKGLSTIIGYESTLDSVITVLAPSDIEELTTQNYLFRDIGEMAFIKSDDLFDVEVYDIVGRKVKTYSDNKELLIRKEEYERGVYFARVSIGGVSKTEKFLVE